ncbi:MAG: hypothetical protein K8T10_18395 [Candidatus Eremiobacteraeota bacterium]|nr:hypothetical protein [Candidatus Eremiobacteraeota bacterium]
MNKKTLILGAVGFLLGILITFMVVPRHTVAAKEFTEMEIAQMVKDVQSLNLLNGLHLSEKQMKELLPIAEKVRKEDAKLKSLYQKKFGKAHEILEEMKSQLMKNNDLSDGLKKRYHPLSEEIRKKKVEYDEEMDILSKDVASVLNENQKVLLREYQPCLVPVKSIANPDRIGQAGGGEIIQKGLEKIRKVPDAAYPSVKEIILERAEEKIKLYIHDEKYRQKVLKQVATAMDKARTMSDEEFEMKKQELASSIEIHQTPTGNVEERYIKTFLLNPHLYDILKKKLALVKK